MKCPACESASVSYLKKRRQYDCNACRKRFSVRAGTIFNDSKLPLRKWFMAVYIMCESKKSVSANQLKRMLGVSYKTAWYLCHRIREAMKVEDAKKLSGVIEMDETFLGGKRKTGRQGPHGKTVVIGAVERGGDVRLAYKKSRRKGAIADFMDEHVEDGAEALYTDAYNVYPFEARERDIPHDSVNRNDHEWVHGQVHTNTIESVWSLLDRSIIGAYHKISTKHLPRYLDELEWRHNNRSNPFLFRDTLLRLIGAEQLEYKNLTA